MLIWLTAEISPRPLGLARLIVGAAATIRAVVAIPTLTKLTQPETLRAPFFDWFPVPTPVLVATVMAVWFVAAILFTIGWRLSFTGPVLLGSIVFSLSLDLQTYSNHLYLMAWLVLLLTIADAGAGLSIERKQRPAIRWPVLLLMTQASVVYGFAAITKLNADFLSGRVLAGVLNGGIVSFPDALRTSEFLGAVAIAAVFAELFIALFLWSPRFRPAAFILGLGLHATITLFMGHTGELLVFSLEMLALYPLFLTQDPLLVIWDDQCASCKDWITRFRRIDLLDALVPIGKNQPGHDIGLDDVERSIHLVHGKTTRGFAAITRILEHLVPTLWIAPILRLPGVRHLGEWWYRWQAGRRSCAVALGSRPSKPVSSES